MSFFSLPKNLYFSSTSLGGESLIISAALSLDLLCYESMLKGLSKEATLVLSNTRELDRVPNTK